MIYVVIDTNVLVFALLNMNSNPGSVLLSVFKGKTIPLLNPEILAEYREVLARKKFKFPAEEIETVLKELTSSCLNVTALSKDYPEVNDPKDRCFYAVTMTGRQTEDVLLVTGNIRHFPQKPFIITPAQCVKILQVAK